MTNYNLLCEQLRALTKDVSNDISNYANASALLFHSLDDINWVGFYLLSKNILELGPFQGKPACTKISVGSGVCGKAVQLGETIVVDNVHQFEGHIACDSASNSEIVIPLRKKGEIVAVLDIDSPLFARFTQADKEGLEQFSEILEKILF